MREILVFLLGMMKSAESGTGYTFSAHNDPGNPVAYAACLHRDMDDKKDAIIAHRTLPCSTKVVLVNTKNNRWTVATVGDRGPFGRRRNGAYRGIVDMSPVVNRRLKAKGKAPIVLIPLDNKEPEHEQ